VSNYSGSCHCGVLSVRYQTDLQLSAWSLRACQCTFCRRHGALSTSDPQGEIAFQASDETRLVRYRFGMRTADFLICGGCGVYLGTQTQSPAGRIAVLNVRCLLLNESDLPARQPMHYEAESPESRLARRQARWTPVARDSL
jgi:hypothetical protein